MRRKLFAIAAGGIAVVGANRLLARRADALEAPLDGQERTYRWRGMDVKYTEAGDVENPDVLLLHGINAVGSSREFAQAFDALSENYHVIAPDLPGFGRSDRPPISYSADLYEKFLVDFAGTLTDDAVCVASSLTGAYAVAAAEEVDFSQLVLVCPTAKTTAKRRGWVETLFRTPLVGTALFNAIVSKPALRWFNADHAYHSLDSFTEADVAYQWQTGHQPGARFAPAAFVGGQLDPDIDLEAALASLDVPVTLVWGREAEHPPLEAGRELAESADARLVVFDDAKLLPHDEHPAEFVKLLERELLFAKHE